MSVWTVIKVWLAWHVLAPVVAVVGFVVVTFLFFVGWTQIVRFQRWRATRAVRE